MCIDRLGLSGPVSRTNPEDWTAFLAGFADMIAGDWAVYRQALRDVPQQEGFPYSVEFPQPPQETV